MPAFTFEKLPPQPDLSASPSDIKEAGETKQRGRVIRILDRLIERRSQRAPGGNSETPKNHD